MFKVVLADDESLITLGLKALLDWEDYGFEIVYTAESGEEALAYLKEHSIDLLITDILMGEMSGLQLIKEAKKIQPKVKSVVLTGYQEFEFIKEGLLLGIENYLVKPVDEDELLTTIQNVGRKLATAPAEVSILPEDDLTTLMDNTLWRFLNGEIDYQDFLERLSLFTIDIHEPYYTVSILNFEHYQDSTVTKAVRDMIEADYSPLCLYSPNHELIIIISGASEKELVKVNERLVEQLCKMQVGTGFFYLSMGKAATNIDQLEESYSIAMENSLMQLSSKPNVLLTNESFSRREELKELQKLKESLVKALINEEDDSLRWTEHFFTYLTRSSTYISPQVVKRYSFDLISYIHYSVQPSDISLYTAAVERMVYASDIMQLKAVLEEYCQELLLLIKDQFHMRSPIVQNVLSYIHNNFNQGLSLKIMGQQFHVNAIYLGQLFQKEVGVVFSEYLNRYRLEKAKEMLKTTHERAGEIGKKVGYSDTTYFYKQFKKSIGTTPSEWRKIQSSNLVEK